jgi:exopolysaccharide biosynthesis predicted pyruvyltransferase EpsI
MHSFDEYCALVRGASVVVTDRLHVAIPAALLGTPVELMDSGYHKLRGVYERSLADLPHVHLVDR